MPVISLTMQHKIEGRNLGLEEFFLKTVWSAIEAAIAIDVGARPEPMVFVRFLPTGGDVEQSAIGQAHIVDSQAVPRKTDRIASCQALD